MNAFSVTLQMIRYFCRLQIQTLFS